MGTKHRSSALAWAPTGGHLHREGQGADRHMHLWLSVSGGSCTLLTHPGPELEPLSPASQWLWKGGSVLCHPCLRLDWNSEPPVQPFPELVCRESRMKMVQTMPGKPSVPAKIYFKKIP